MEGGVKRLDPRFCDFCELIRKIPNCYARAYDVRIGQSHLLRIVDGEHPLSVLASVEPNAIDSGQSQPGSD